MTPDTSRFAPNFTGKPRIYAHRGSSLRAPENTMKAFALGLDEGADGVELDVRRCASGEIVVAHDHNMQRTAGVPARVAELAFEKLKELDVGSGERVPKLDDVIDLAAVRAALLNVEIKADDDDMLRLVKSVAHVLTRRSKKDRELVLVSSFHPFVCGAMRFLHPEVPVGFLFEDDLQGRALAMLAPRVANAAAVHPNHALVTERAMSGWRKRRHLVNVWTVDEPETARRLSALHVDGLITNDVPKIREALLNP